MAGTIACGRPFTSRISGVAQVSISLRGCRHSSLPSRVSSAATNDSPFR